MATINNDISPNLESRSDAASEVLKNEPAVPPSGAPADLQATDDAPQEPILDSRSSSQARQSSKEATPRVEDGTEKEPLRATTDDTPQESALDKNPSDQAHQSSKETNPRAEEHEGDKEALRTTGEGPQESTPDKHPNDQARQGSKETTSSTEKDEADKEALHAKDDTLQESTLSSHPSDQAHQSSEEASPRVEEHVGDKETLHAKDDGPQESTPDKHPSDQTRQNSKETTRRVEVDEGSPEVKPDVDQATQDVKTQDEQKSEVATEGRRSPVTESKDPIDQVSAQLKSVTIKDDDERMVKTKDNDQQHVVRKLQGRKAPVIHDYGPHICIASKIDKNNGTITPCIQLCDTRAYRFERYLCWGHRQHNFLRGHVFRLQLNNTDLRQFFFPKDQNTTATTLTTPPSTPPARSEASYNSDTDEAGFQDTWRPTGIKIRYNSKDKTVFSAAKFEELTEGLEPLLKHNVWQLIVDFFWYLGRRMTELRVHHMPGSESYFARKMSYAGTGDGYMRDIHGCKQRGIVYILRYEPSMDGVRRMVRESQQVPARSIALKIGYSANITNRIVSHSYGCGMDPNTGVMFPSKGSVPFAHLFEKVMHEILVAHQHDIWCRAHKQTHIEMFWFPRYSDDIQGTDSYWDTVEELSPIFEKWLSAFQQLDRLHRQLFDDERDYDDDDDDGEIAALASDISSLSVAPGH